MSDINDSFLKGLQQDCLVSIDDQHQELVQTLNADFSASPGKVIGTFLKECHSMKGNLQAVGFKFFSEYIHEFESGLQSVQVQIGNGDIADSQQKGILEFFLSDVLSHISAYKSALMSTFKDEEKIKNSKMMSVAVIKDWRASSGAGAVAEAAPVSTPETNEAAPVQSEPVAEIDFPPLVAAEVAPLVDKKPESPASEEIGSPAKDPFFDMTPSELTAAMDNAKSGGTDKTKTGQSEGDILAEIEAKVDAVQAIEKETQKLKEESGESNRFLIFKIDDRNLAVNVKNVVEVSQWLKITPLPKKKDGILGLINWMGEILPVVDFSDNSRLAKRDEAFPFILITKMNGNMVAVGVDGVDQVSTVDTANFESLPETFSNNGRSLMTHIGRFEQKTVVLVNFDQAGVA